MSEAVAESEKTNAGAVIRYEDGGVFGETFTQKEAFTKTDPRTQERVSEKTHKNIKFLLSNKPKVGLLISKKGREDEPTRYYEVVSPPKEFPQKDLYIKRLPDEKARKLMAVGRQEIRFQDLKFSEETKKELFGVKGYLQD